MSMSVPGNSCRGCGGNTTTPGCVVRLPGTCVYYSGLTIPSIGVNTGDNFDTIINKLNGGLVTATNGLTKTGPSIALGGNLTQTETLIARGTGKSFSIGTADNTQYIKEDDFGINLKCSNAADQDLNLLLQLSTLTPQLLLSYTDDLGIGSFQVSRVGSEVITTILGSGGFIQIQGSPIGGLGLCSLNQMVMRLAYNTSDPVNPNPADSMGSFYFNQGVNQIRFKDVSGWGQIYTSGSLQGGLFQANGGVTVYSIPHNLSNPPSKVNVTAASAAAAQFLFYVSSIDVDNINITFNSAPSSGTNNVKLYWMAAEV